MELTPEATLELLQNVCETSRDLLKKGYQAEDTSVAKLNGFCYPLSEAMYYLHPGQFYPCRINWADLGGSGTHWFLRHTKDNRVLETTNRGGKPVCKPSEYMAGRRQRGFISPKPSKRCVELIERAGLSLKERVGA